MMFHALWPAGLNYPSQTLLLHIVWHLSVQAPIPILEKLTMAAHNTYFWGDTCLLIASLFSIWTPGIGKLVTGSFERL